MKNKTPLLAILLLLFAVPAMAQYGTGVEADVPRAPAGSIVIDGSMDDPVWDAALIIDPLANWSTYGDFASEDPDLTVDTRLLWAEDTLYIFMEVFDNDIFVAPDSVPWTSDQLLIGIDPTHAGDSLYDADFAGAPQNAPDLGPYTYKVSPDGITLDWTPVDPEAGLVNAVVFRDDENLVWGIEAALYVPQIDQSTGKRLDVSQIGFNVGGAQSSQAAWEGTGDAYAYYSWQICSLTGGEFCTYAGGAVMSDARSFATLNMVGGGGGGEGYGVNKEFDVPRAPAGSITIDGDMSDPVWDAALIIDPLANWSTYGDFASPEPDLSVDARVLWAEDTLYMFVKVLDNDIFVAPDSVPWTSDQLLIGIDPTHAGDSLYDANFAGAPQNAPDLGPYAYKVNPDSITLDWTPVASDAGLVHGVVFRDDENLEWGFEAAFYVPQIDKVTGKKLDVSQIGFNFGGAQSSQAAWEATGDAYAYYSWQVCDLPGGEFCTYAGGAVMSDARSFATLNMVGGGGGGEGYGVNKEFDVARAQAGSVVIDGVKNEAAWEGALVVDPLANWSTYGDFASPEPDMALDTRLLWNEDTLYLYMEVLDNDIFVAPDSVPWTSDQLLIGIDPTHAGDSLYDANFAGAPQNAPDLGPYAYKVNPDSLTLDWTPVASDAGLAHAVVFRDDENLTWGIEAAFYVPQIDVAAGKGFAASQIGFNIGGAQSSQAAWEATGDAYAYYSWQVCDLPGGEFCTYAGGAVMSDARSFATLNLVETVNPAVEEDPIAGVPEQFMLSQNYPNPFNPTTTIEYGLKTPSRATLDVFNVYGQRVARLIDEQKAAGTYRLTWEAESLPSGMYIYQLRVDGTLVDSKSMTLIK